MKLGYEILDRTRRALLPTLARLKREGFYLAGGTGLALQLQHRRSLDFDFYTQSEFDPQRVYADLATHVRAASLVRTADGTLISRLNGVECSAFQYRYPLLKPLIINEYLAVASVEDIAAMKLAAIIQRGAKRDFFDLYVLLKRFELKKLLALTRKKYPGMNEYLMLQALTYFDEADRDPEGMRLKPVKPMAWDDVKRQIEQSVRTFIRGA